MWRVEREFLDAPLREELTTCWVDVTNAGGAVGFPHPPVDAAKVAAAVDELAARVESGRCALVIAHDDAGVCGWVVLERNTFSLTTHWAWVRRLQTHPRRQRQGIASGLLRRLENLARDEWHMEFLHLVLRGRMGLERFYQRLGWREVGRIPHALRLGVGDDRDEVHMVKPLRPDPSSAPVEVRDATSDDASWLTGAVRARWHETFMVLDGEIRPLLDQPALVAVRGDERLGYLIYERQPSSAEILALEATLRGQGVGRTLVTALAERRPGSLVAVTTNDNLAAIAFYQRLSFRLTQVRVGAVDKSRAVKPSIPLAGELGIEIHDELVFQRSADT